MIDKARQFAIAAHGDQKYGDRPYAYHLDAVAATAEPYGEIARVIAYLHDVVEDTPVETDEIEAHFGEFVACCVAILTDEPGSNRAERKRKTYAKMANVRGEHELALVVKAADRLANISACVADGHQRKLQMYVGEHDAFQRAAYRPGLCEELWLAMSRVLEGQPAD